MCVCVFIYTYVLATNAFSHLYIKYIYINLNVQVSFKIIHCIYPVNEVIKRFENDIDLKCVFCKVNNESTGLLFVDCTCPKLFWSVCTCVFVYIYIYMIVLLYTIPQLGLCRAL